VKSHIHKSVTVFNKPLEEVFEFFSIIFSVLLVLVWKVKKNEE